MSFPKPEPGHWAYEAVLDLDRLAPGLLGEVLRGTHTRRQVVCAALSLRDWINLSQHGKLALAQKLRFAKTQVLIADTFGSNPEGFIACLAKMGPCYQPPDFYAGLYLLYVNPLASEAIAYLNRRRAFAVEFACIVPPGIVRLATLGSVFLKRDLFDLVGFLCCASEVECIVRFLRRATPKVADDEIVDALINTDWAKPLDLVVKCFIGGRRVSPVDALSADSAFECLSTGELLQRAGNMFSNCLGGRVYEKMLLRKRDLFFIWRGDEPAVLRLTRAFGFWRLQEVKGPKNRPLSPAAAHKLATILEPLGIFCPLCGPSSGSGGS